MPSKGGRPFVCGICGGRKKRRAELFGFCGRDVDWKAEREVEARARGDDDASDSLFAGGGDDVGGGDEGKENR